MAAMAMTVAFARSVAIMGDEQPRRSKPPDLLLYEERADTRATTHVRSGKKVGDGMIRENIRKRVDAGAEVRCMKLAAAQMSQGEWQAYIALKEGVLFDTELGTGRRSWRVVPLPAKTATSEQAAQHYKVQPGTIERYDREARRVLDMFRAAAGLTGDQPRIPIWPAVQDDESLLRYLFPSSRGMKR